ncbi:hypothetical protein EVAR_27530_1 [Eumeta japonica]|uniref:Uncharacterized protein n=1 Tax=Eumeta variegata TaxID=151549 RepID=A0A4C1W498_EUMVA|nr:hypothetical protein EVAR_27530_1 [Eumeta japonica]
MDDNRFLWDFKEQTSMRIIRKQMVTAVHGRPQTHRSRQCIAGLSKRSVLFLLKSLFSQSTGNTTDGKSFQNFTMRGRKLTMKCTLVERQPSSRCRWYFQRVEQRWNQQEV